MTTPEATQEVPEGTIQQGAAAETVTVSTEPQAEELLAGKFKSQDDLVKAYKELESKLGQQQPQQAQEPAEAETQEQTDTTEETEDKTEAKEDAGDDPYADYGEAVGNALKAAEVDPLAAQQEFERDGTLSDETFEKFEKAGFPKEMVEAYLRGVAQATEQTTEITEAQVAQIKAVAGGEEGYVKLQQWMAVNIDADELNTFNETVGSGDYAAAVAAVSAMNTRYQQDVGTEGNLRGGRPPSNANGYATEAEYLADMAKPEYKTSEAFRQQVRAKLANSPDIFVVR